MSCWNTTALGRTCDQNVTVKSLAAEQTQRHQPMSGSTGFLSSEQFSFLSQIHTKTWWKRRKKSRSSNSSSSSSHCCFSLSITPFSCQPDRATVSPWHTLFPTSFQLFPLTSFHQNGYLSKVTLFPLTAQRLIDWSMHFLLLQLCFPPLW